MWQLNSDRQWVKIAVFMSHCNLELRTKLSIIRFVTKPDFWRGHTQLHCEEMWGSRCLVFRKCKTSMYVVWQFGCSAHAEEEKKSCSLFDSKRWHPYCPCSWYFAVALNMKLCTSEQMLFCLALGCERFDEIRPSGVWRHGQRDAYLSGETLSSCTLSGLANHVMFHIADSHG